MHRSRPVHLALATLIFIYLGTTGIGAAIATTGFGRAQLQEFFSVSPVPFDWLKTLGSPLYWTLLLQPILIVPVVALVAERATERLAPSLALPDLPTWIAVGLASLFAAFCIYKLAEAGGLSAHEAWDRSFCYQQQITRRVELMQLLGNRFYAFAYSSLPVVAFFLLAKGILQKSRSALFAFAVLSAIIAWLYIAMIMKAPLVIYVGLCALTVVLCRFTWRSAAVATLIAVPLAAGIYFGLSALQICPTEHAAWQIKEQPEAPAAAGNPVAAPSSAPTHLAQPSDKIVRFSRNAVFRMASAFPYYVQTFSNPEERCGVELPLALASQRCYPPTKMFKIIFPSVDYVTGFAPAGATLTAYAELGLFYSFVVAVIVGAIIGFISVFAGTGDPLRVTIGVALCMFCYYVTQSSLTGSLIHSYGLIWLLLPILIMITASATLSQSRRATLNAQHP